MSEEKEEIIEQVEETTEQTEAAEELPGSLGKVKELQNSFYKACGDLFDNMDYVGEPLYNLMLCHYYEQYKREYERMNAEEFIEVDKQIEQLKIKRDEELETIKLERDKLRAELKNAREKELETIKLEHDKLAAELEIERDRELEELQLKHMELLAEIERKRKKLYEEIEVLASTADMENEAIKSEIIPEMHRKHKIGRFYFGKVITNHAMELSLAAANTEVNDYLAQREEQVAAGAAAFAKKYEAQSESNNKEPDSPAHSEELEVCEKEEIKPESRRARKRRERQQRKRREAALRKLEKTIRNADKQDLAKALEEPENGTETPEEDKLEQTDENENKAAGGKIEPEEDGKPAPTTIHL